MWFVFLYSTLIPIGAVISVFGLIFYYWIDKYNLLRRSKVHGKVSGHFIRTSLFLLDFTLIMKPIGSLMFDIHLRDQKYQTSSIVMICIAFVYIVIPKFSIIRFFNFQRFNPEDKTYSQIKHKFALHNYYTNHPLFHSLYNEEQKK